jgi:DNA-binding MarR family transcriptional regulator
MAEGKRNHGLGQQAEDIFALTKLAFTARARARAGTPEVLSETEFLSLDVLVQDGPTPVGGIQKRIGVLPAQMSRIIRALESKGGEAFVVCAINPNDRRKIDVRITPKGRNAHRTYRAARLKMSMDILKDLSAGDRSEFVRILGLIRAAMAQRTHTE